MKLNYRDKVLLTVVIVALVCVLGIMFFIKPAIEDVKAANDSLDSAKATLSDLQAQIEADKDLDERIAQAYSDVEVLMNDFYTYQETQEATQVVDTLLADKTVDLLNSDMTISEYSSTILTPYAYASNVNYTDMDIKVDEYANADLSAAAETDADAEASGSTAAASTDTSAVSTESVIGCYDISFEFTGTMEGVKTFCQNLKTNTEKTLVLESLEIKYDSDEEGNVSSTDVSGSMNLKMIVLKKLDNPDK